MESSATAVSSVSLARASRRKAGRPVLPRDEARRRASNREPLAARHQALEVRRRRRRRCRALSIEFLVRRAADENASPYAFLFRPSGVGYVVSSDGMLHVLGLASGKDLQRPAAFLPANSKWSAPVAVDTTLYAATSGKCGGAPAGVWAIDLDSDQKPVVSWKTNGGEVVGAVAFTPDGTLIAAIGPGKATGDGKVNAIVALDPKTLQIKDWFSQPTAEFVTGPTIIRHNNRNIVAAATKDGRVLLLDAASLGGSNHDTPLAASTPAFGAGSAVSADALAAWQEQARWHVVDSASRLREARRQQRHGQWPYLFWWRGGAESCRHRLVLSRSRQAGFRTISRRRRLRSSSTE